MEGLGDRCTITRNRLEKISLGYLLVIAVSSLSLYIYYNTIILLYDSNIVVIEDYIKPYDLIIPIMCAYVTIDFFIIRSYLSKLHHICVLIIIFYNYYYNVSANHRFLFLYPLINTEISCIFYVMRYCIPKTSVLHTMNLILFYIAFLKFRIYDFYYKILFTDLFNIAFLQYSNANYLLSALLIVSCYILYFLNLYWFMLMNKILYKILVKDTKYNSDILCRYLCSYIFLLNIPLSFYIYANNIQGKHIIDFTGIIILTITTYKYHSSIYTRLRNNDIEEYNVPDNHSIILFMNDIIAIHIRALFSVITNYFDTVIFYYVMFIFTIIHCLSIYFNIVLSVKLILDYDKYKNNFTRISNIIMAIVSGFDMLVIYINSPNKIAIPFLIISILLSIITFSTPFYRLSHAAFHVVLIIHTYYICLSNTA